MSAKPGQRNALELDDYAEGVARGDRATLARAITLIESSREEHQALARELLQRILPATGKAVRVGITGVPGVGKSSMIEQLGTNLTAAGHKVAVLAVDPSSERSGGSILGDKTRMPQLAQDPKAFIRPSPSSGTLGGVTKKTRETMALCEAAGFDVVLIETVGVGQSETAVADLVDLFCLLLPPAGGDELQGIKKGVVELADVAVVNKADGSLKQAASRAAAEYQSALRMLRPAAAGWIPPVLQVSALEGRGFEKVWKAMADCRAALGAEGLKAKRAGQAKAWFWRELQEGLVEAFRRAPAVAEALPGLEAEVAAGRMTAARAAETLLALFRESDN